jgi:EAL and modified HD-GYP domain-containing signal transduction protein
MNEEIFVARQPILNRNRELYAYELLFRGKRDAGGSGGMISDMSATNNVLDGVLNNIGIDKIVGNAQAFLNCCYDFMLSGIHAVLNPGIFVLEILETVPIDDKIVDVVKDLHGKGFKIAIDDFVPDRESMLRVHKLLPYLSICKLEYPAITDPTTLFKVTEFFHKHNIQVLVEKVETEADYKICYETGADYFQGYYFAKPEIASSVKIASDVVGVFQILQLMNDKTVEIAGLEKEFKAHPDLTIKLLKYLNSAAFAMRAEITSIRHALSLLGMANIKQWLVMLTYSEPNVSLEKSPLLSNAVMRANFCMSIAKKKNWSKERIDKVYLAGLISHLDAVYKISIEDLLKQIPLDEEIKQALLEKNGDIWQLIFLISLVEQDDFQKMDEFLPVLKLSHKDVSESLAAAY